jgi:gliding motility-associated-like protein
MTYNKKIIIFIYLLCNALCNFATHNRAGEITYKHISGFTYEFTITTYTKLSGESEGADRPRLEIVWGDGNRDSINRIAQNTTQYPDVFENIYRMRHTYTGPGNYIVSMSDPNRIGNIINMTNSVNTIFYIEDTVIILNPNNVGYNSSPTLYNQPLDAANVGQRFVHNPNAFDIDGDSMSFTLIPSKQSQISNVNGYLYPNQIFPGINNQFTINNKTGEIIWEYPQAQGIYNIAILIREYRAGILIGTVVRDMQIFVDATNNRPPVLTVPNNICVVAGDSVRFSISASDLDVGQLVTLTSNSTAYSQIISPAVFNANAPNNPVSGTFRWKTDCTHLNKNEYPILFKAQDNFNTPPLVDIKTVFVKIIAPAPQNLIATLNLIDNSVKLTWDSVYACSNNSRFLHFSIWRKNGCGNVNDTCNSNLVAQGYQKISTTKLYTFIDNTIEVGNEYSYKVVAEFGDVPLQGVPLNTFSGLASEEVCVRLPLSLPILYNVDVKNTSETSGQIYIEWSRPNAIELDTTINIAPYTFVLLRADGLNGTNYTPISTKTFTSFSSINDTSFLDTNLNTQQNIYNYKILFVVNNDTLGYSGTSSSVYLYTIPDYKSINLSWNFSTAWQNYEYVIYRKLPGSLTYDSIAIVSTPNYKDTGLIIDSTYCYKIKAIGKYNISSLKTPLINFSQESCAVPIDTTSPCPAILSIDNFCKNPSLTQDDFINFLTWNFNVDCDTSNIVKTNIYYKSFSTPTYVLLDSINRTTLLMYNHNLNTVKSLAGCYYVETVGKNTKKSTSNIVCVDDCPIYELPNTFTPNHDGQNDLYTPILPYRGVSKIEMKVYNRWGNLVFETNNPDINWNGEDSKNEKELNSAVYYYICYIYYKTANGEQKLTTPLSGYIHLFR